MNQKQKPSNTRPGWMAVTGIALLTAAALWGCSKNSPTQPPVPLPPVGQVIINIQVDTLAVGQPVRFTATALDTNGTPIPGASFGWSSTNPGIFTASGTTVATVVGQSPGTAGLIASVGGKADTSMVTIIQGLGWVLQNSNTSSNLNGVNVRPNGRYGWAVGSGGRIVNTMDAGLNWANQQSNTTFDLHGVWSVSDMDVWAVGANGAIRHTMDAGATWDIITTGGAIENLFDVQFVTPSLGFAVGASGVIIRTRNGGATWDRTTPTTATLRSVSFSDTRNGWAVGDGGTVVGTTNGGDTWTVAQSVTSQRLNAVHRRSFSYGWAAGIGGAAPYTFSGASGVEWALDNAGANNALYGLWYVTDDVGWTVGWNTGGIILRTDDSGQTWEAQASNSNFQLNDVFFVDQGKGWAVGNNGVISHTGTGGF